MKHFLIRVAYDGTSYHGFQVQPEAPTIEGRLNEALYLLTGEKIKVTGGSRTDAGVHAYDNVACFGTDFNIPADRLPYALNVRLPEDIRVLSAYEVSEDFHPRHCDTRKTYEYRIINSQFPIPTFRNYSYHTYYKLDIGKMKEAAAYLTGEHDFKAFSSANGQTLTTVRTIYSTDILTRELNEIIIRITGNGFLYNMVRIIAGTLLDAGRGKLAPEDIPYIIESRERKNAGPTLPPQGLTLVKYEYVQGSR